MTVRRFAATVAYHGARFAGSQKQANAPTVQEDLERAAMELFGVPTRVAMAGRTDSGVHAIGQVAAFDAETRHDAATVGRALNAHLPPDVAVRLVAEVPPDFDPRYWARKRTYRYTVLQSEVRDPMLRDRAWHVRDRLDVPAMNRAAAALTGTRDFRAVAGPLEPWRNPVRTVMGAEWHVQGQLLLFDIAADSFLPQMVRRIVGGLVRIGKDARTYESFVRLLAEAEPGSIGPTAPPHGLCLQEVTYQEGYLV